MSAGAQTVACLRWRTWTSLAGATLLGVGLATWYLLYVPTPDVIALSKNHATDLAQLPILLREHRVVLVGEWHGLIEPVDTVKRLLVETPSECRFTHLTFELPISDQPDADRYLAGDDTALKQLGQRYARFPIGTDEYVSLFSFVREWNRAHREQAITVRLIDVKSPVHGTLEEQRDEHMFGQIESILATSEGSRVLAYVGADHAVRSGFFHYDSKERSRVPAPILGPMLHRRHPGQVASIKVLHHGDPLWQKLAEAKAFTGPVAIRLTAAWTRPLKLIKVQAWRPDPGTRTADQIFDYLIWWPTSRPGTKTR